MEYGLVIWWLVAYLAFMVVGMPLAAVLFPRLADRGAGLALATALGVLWIVAYLVGHVSLTAGLYLGLAILVAAAVVAVYRGVEIDRRQFAETAIVFTIAFGLMIAIRAVDASVHPGGGEKFLDFGLLRSILRANVLPPEDIWFAGQPVQYYYGGHLLAALLTRVTGTAPRYAYNLAHSGFYAMLVTAAYGLAGSIAASRGVTRVRAGALGAFFVGFAANLATVSAFVFWLLPDGLSSFVGGLIGYEPGGLAQGGLDEFSYWSASRVIDGTINEFPLFAWLNGDMHAHMMSAPFVLLAAGLLFSYYTLPESERTRRGLLVFGAVPPIAGLLAVVNTWSFPTVGGLTFLTLALAPTNPLTLLPSGMDRSLPSEGPDHELYRHAAALGGAVIVVLLALLWSLPFWFGTASSRSIAFFPDRSSMGPFLVVHGAFVLVFALYLVRHAVPVIEREHFAEVTVMLALGFFLAWGGGSAAAVAVLGPMILVGWILLRTQANDIRRLSEAAVDAGSNAVSNGGAAVADAVPSRAEPTVERVRDTVGYETILLIAGAGIVVLVEFVYVEEQAGPERLNTVFKTYADVWVLWAVAAGAMLANLIENHSPALALTGDRWEYALRVFAILLVVSTSMYGAFALSNHFSTESSGFYNHPDEPTLDSLRFVSERHPTEAHAIAWFDDLEGQPNIASAPGTDMYRWTNPVSSLTGVPTLAGWQHEVGYRGHEVYNTRVEHVDAIYTGSPEVRAHYLEAYQVEYVYVGPNERGRYTNSDLAVFDSMDGVTLEQQWDDVQVYRVNHDELPDSGG